MCPVCMTTAALIATGSASAGGLAALVAKVVRAGANVQRVVPPKDEARQKVWSQNTLSQDSREVTCR